jgi:hypothetical protein
VRGFCPMNNPVERTIRLTEPSKLVTTRLIEAYNRHHDDDHEEKLEKPK